MGGSPPLQNFTRLKFPAPNATNLGVWICEGLLYMATVGGQKGSRNHRDEGCGDIIIRSIIAFFTSLLVMQCCGSKGLAYETSNCCSYVLLRCKYCVGGDFVVQETQAGTSSLTIHNLRADTFAERSKIHS